MRKNRVAELLFGFVASSCASMAALASTSSGPAVPSFLSYQTSGIVQVFFLLSVRSGTVPACAGAASGTYYRLVFDSTTPGGKSMLAGLIAAHAAAEPVWPVGTGDCGVDGSNESLKNFGTSS